MGIHDVLREVLQESGHRDITTKRIMQTVGLPLDTSIARLINEPETSRSVSDMVSAYRQRFDAVVLPAAKSLVYEGVVDGLEELTQIGAKLAVATSKVQASAEKLLQAAGLSHFFTVIVGTDRVARPKPHADMVQFILRTLESAERDAIMVGDTPHDIQMAANAGIKSIGVTYGVGSTRDIALCEPTCVAHTFSDVVSCVRTIRTGHEESKD